MNSKRFHVSAVGLNLVWIVYLSIRVDWGALLHFLFGRDRSMLMNERLFLSRSDYYLLGDYVMAAIGIVIFGFLLTLNLVSLWKMPGRGTTL